MSISSVQISVQLMDDVCGHALLRREHHAENLLDALVDDDFAHDD